jgi:hypothetical protein
MQITFNGNPLNFIMTGSTANYNIYTAGISAYAGQTGLLQFSVPANSSGGFLDNIQFSTQAVPEPSEFALFALGGIFFGTRYWRKTMFAMVRLKPCRFRLRIDRFPVRPIHD